LTNEGAGKNESATEAEIGGGHVVPLFAVGGESLNGFEDMTEEIERGFPGMAAADVADAIDGKFLVLGIARVGEAVGEKKQRITGQKLQGEFVVCGGRKQAGGQAGDLEQIGFIAAKEKRAGHAGADDAHAGGAGIKERVLDSGVAAGDAPEEQAFVQGGEHAARMLAGFVDTAEGANGERGVESGGEAFAGDIADVQTDGAITEGEIVEIVAPPLRRRVEIRARW
jgi:hypothetical protein